MNSSARLDIHVVDSLPNAELSAAASVARIAKLYAV